MDIPNDEMKGRIIGREGRNIRAFEKFTGVDVIVDDTPGVVIVSAFDNVRREIAKLALRKLIQEGRIHPSRIEEIVAETQKEMEEHIRHLGQEAAQEAPEAAVRVPDAVGIGAVASPAHDAPPSVASTASTSCDSTAPPGPRSERVATGVSSLS